MSPQSEEDAVPPREPIFNLPSAIIWLAAAMILVHLLRRYVLTGESNSALLLAASFIPARYGELAGSLPYPAAAFWSPVSYVFLHADWMHLGMNVLWMLAFGSPVARRLGTTRFLVLSLLAAVSGAAAYVAISGTGLALMIGASAVVSGHTGAAARFAFHGMAAGRLNIEGPALTLTQSLTNRAFLTFAGVWLAINLLSGAGLLTGDGSESNIAWQAHLGGFLAGILAFSLFDRRRIRSGPE